MRGLLWKDAYCFSAGYKQTLGIMVVLYSLLALGTKADYLIYTLCYLFPYYTLSSFAADERAHWDRYAQTLPLTTRQLVGGKYLVSLLASLAGLAYCALFGLLRLVGMALGLLQGFPPLSDLLFTGFCILLLSLLMSSVQLPLVVRFGLEKSRLISLAGFALLFGASFFLLSHANVSAIPDSAVLLAMPLAAAVTLLCYWASFCLSCRLYRKKEF